MSKSLDNLQKMQRGEIPPPPIAQLLGFRLAAVEPGRVVIEFKAKPEHANPMGTLHGGVFCDIADAAMGMAYASLLGHDESFATLELKINLLRPVFGGLLVADGRVVQAGRSVGMVEADVTDAKGRLVARATSTCMTLRGEQADGRRPSYDAAAGA